MHPDHRIKYSEGRFTLMQLYKIGKMESTCSSSTYDALQKNIVEKSNDFQECNERTKYGQCEWGEFKGNLCFLLLSLNYFLYVHL